MNLTLLTKNNKIIMQEFTAIIEKKGKDLGFAIPEEVIDKEQIKIGDKLRLIIIKLP